MANSEEKRFDERLKCYINSLSYDFKTQTGTLYLSRGGCCDMTGCINLFRAIDPLVTKILTYSGDEEDTFYRVSDLKWLACRPEDGVTVGDIDKSYFEK